MVKKTKLFRKRAEKAERLARAAADAETSLTQAYRSQADALKRSNRPKKGKKKLGKPPARTQAEVVSDRLALGVALLKRKAGEPARFAVLAFERFKVNAQSAIVYRAMAAAALYGRPTGNHVRHLLECASYAIPTIAARSKLETVIKRR